MPSIKQDYTGLNGVAGNGVAGQVDGFVKATGYDNGYCLVAARDNTYTRIYQYDIDASRCSDVYNKSATVTPLSESTLLCIRY